MPAPIHEVWNFFSNPDNLNQLTPAKMHFRHVFKTDAEQVFEGMCIVHSLSPIAGVRITWVSRIVAVEPLKRFVDVQVKGPFALWHHIHAFRKVDEYTEISDILYYAMPMGFIGDIVHSVFVGDQIREIFSFRSKQLKGIFQ